MSATDMKLAPLVKKETATVFMGRNKGAIGTVKMIMGSDVMMDVAGKSTLYKVSETAWLNTDRSAQR